MRRRVLLLSVFLPASLGAAAGPFAESDVRSVREILDAIYRLDYNRAFETAGRLRRESPRDPLGNVFWARTLWQREITRNRALSLSRFAAPDFFVEEREYKYKLEPDPEVEAEFSETTRAAIEAANEQLRREPADMRAWFLRGLAYQNLVTFNASFHGGWRKAFFDGDKARRSHERVNRAYPEFADSLLALGVYDYVAGSVNWFYRFWGVLLGIRGDRKRGIESLERAARESLLLADDARTMLVLLYTRERRYEEAFDILSALRRAYPENYYYPLEQGTLCLAMRRPSDAVSIYREVLAELARNPAYPGRIDPAAVLNEMGVALRQEGDLEASAGTLRSVLARKEVYRHDRTVARLELGKTLDLLGRREEAVRQYRQVIEAGNVRHAAGEARRLLEQPYRR
jgi:tetratricopeptide (TPR) repeat protein